MIFQRTKRGLSLIETMVAVFVFGIFITGTLSLLSMEWSVIRSTKERQYVGRILESRQEEIRDLTYEQLLDLGTEVTFTPHPAITVFGRAVNSDVVDDSYQLELRDAQGKVYINNIETGLRKVTVQVTWKQAGTSKAVSMNSVTYIAQNGINRL